MLLLSIVISIIAVLTFVRFKKAESGALLKIVIGFCFTFSWVVLAMWFTSLVEVWQIALNTPGAENASLPAWRRTILGLLREAVYLFPTNRLTLGVLYALPFLLIPITLAIAKRYQAILILLFSTLVNLLFFWSQVIVDSSIPGSIGKISVQGAILLMSYLLAFLVVFSQIRGSRQV